MPSLEKYQNEIELNDDLVQLRSGYSFVESKDLTIESVLVAERKIEFWGRNVGTEEFIPKNEDPNKAFIYFHGGSFYGGELDSECYSGNSKVVWQLPG